jgi:hypothetical protein
MSAGEGGYTDELATTNFFPLRDDKSEYVHIDATGTAMQWLTEASPLITGVMIAGNYGRPGGNCIDEWGEFVFLPKAKTQEESVLSLFADNGPHVQAHIVKQLTTGRIAKYRMKLPTGNQTDFEVLDGTNDAGGEWINIQTAGHEPYFREFGFNLAGFQARGSQYIQGVYLSFVSGPNTAPQEHPWPDPRASDTLDSMYRCASLKASARYHVFRRMVRTALRGSLRAMLNERVDRVIIAAISCGIYADEERYRSKIRREYPELCREVILSLYKEQRHWKETHRFSDVLIPTWFSNGSLYGPCKHGEDCPNELCKYEHRACGYEDCSQRDTCPFIHPCKHWDSCTNAKCRFAHPRSRKGSSKGRRKGKGKGSRKGKGKGGRDVSLHQASPVSNGKVKTRFKI